jgi:PAS domain S-box-containing protein
MKLFSKTLLFFIGVIAFQSILTILLVTDVTRRTNLADAHKELDEEAAIIYESFNSWKRQMWISLIGIGGDERLARVLAASQGHPPHEEFAESLREFVFGAKIDYLILRGSPAGALEIVPVSYSTFGAADLAGLTNVKPYPYLELRLIHKVLCLVGVTTIELAPDRRMDVFLLKRIDAEFCNQLTLNRKSQVALFYGERCLVGSFPPAQPAPVFDPRSLQSAYLESYNQRVGGERLNIAFQRIGRLEQQEEGEELFLGTFLSNEPYNQRILLASRVVLLVSLAGALLTILLSLFLSRNITNPIAHLLAGMERIKAGAYDTRVGAGGGYEIARLFSGFDEMAEELHQSRAAMQDYLHETVLLKEYNEKIINSIRAGIAIVNRQLVVEKANSSFLEGFGLRGREVIGRPLLSLGIDLVDNAVLERVRSILQRRQDSFTEVKRCRDARVFEIKLYPFYSSEGQFQEASGCVFMAEDISARTELEHKIFQAEKLSSISMLSAGMAHEINNPLGSILTNVQNLIEEEASPERKVSLKWIEQETRRIARIVQELLNFASADSGHVPGCSVNQVVQETVSLVGCSLAQTKRISIDTRLAPGLPLSAPSADELKQVAINLVKNSIQAIEAEGRILICTGMSERQRCITLSVADTGKGMPKEVIPRVFDPFFTTKGNGAGTGLGLSVVYGIVTKYGGTISVRSREGRGTRIALSLPLLETAQEASLDAAPGGDPA